MDSTSTETLAPFVGKSCDWYDIPCHASGFGEWLMGAMLYIPRKLFELLMQGLAAVIEGIPVPSFFSNAASAVAGIPPGVMWLGDLCHLSEGLAIILSAYVLRFTIRRLPVIG